MVLNIPALLLDALIQLSWRLHTLFIDTDPSGNNVAFRQLIVGKDESTIPASFTQNVNLESALNVFQIVCSV